MTQHTRSLLQILRIGHESSTWGRGISLRQALAEANDESLGHMPSERLNPKFDL